MAFKEPLKSGLPILVQSIDGDACMARCRHEPAQFYQIVKRATNDFYVHVDSLANQPPISHALCRILRVGVRTQIPENQPCHDIVVLGDIPPVHGEHRRQYQYLSPGPSNINYLTNCVLSHDCTAARSPQAEKALSCENVRRSSPCLWRRRWKARRSFFAARAALEILP